MHCPILGSPGRGVHLRQCLTPKLKRMAVPSTLIRDLVLAVIYTFVAFGSLQLFATVNASASPIWPPTGLAIATLLLFGQELWPGVFAGAFVANLLTTKNVPVD